MYAYYITEGLVGAEIVTENVSRGKVQRAFPSLYLAGYALKFKYTKLPYTNIETNYNTLDFVAFYADTFVW